MEDLWRIYGGNRRIYRRLWRTYIEDYGGIMEDVWWICGGFMEDLRRIYGGFMGDLWRIYRIFLDDLWRK